jgi:pyruvate dehydrogenase E1 component alpha subunit
MILEMQTYRYRGHSMSDPAKYRSKDEVQKMRAERDPIEQVRGRLLASKQASEDDLKKIDAAIRAVISEAVEFASRESEPGAAELWTDVLG